MGEFHTHVPCWHFSVNPSKRLAADFKELDEITKEGLIDNLECIESINAKPDYRKEKILILLSLANSLMAHLN